MRQGSGTQPAQYIRLTTAQALAAGILPGVGSHGENGGQQQLQLAGNKVIEKKNNNKNVKNLISHFSFFLLSDTACTSCDFEFGCF